MRGTDARRYSVPTPSHPRPQAVPVARRTEPRCAARYEKREFPRRKLVGRSYRGAQVAAFVSEGVCIKGIGQ